MPNVLIGWLVLYDSSRILKRSGLMRCAWRSCSTEVSGRKNKKFCSRACNLKDKVARYRIERKYASVQLLGGKCSRCGYNKCYRALQFHHIDPSKKLFGLCDGHTRSWEKHKEELMKCILLCANCHAEEEEFLLTVRLTGKTLGC